MLVAQHGSAGNAGRILRQRHTPRAIRVGPYGVRLDHLLVRRLGHSKVRGLAQIGSPPPTSLNSGIVAHPLLRGGCPNGLALAEPVCTRAGVLGGVCGDVDVVALVGDFEDLFASAELSVLERVSAS